MSVVRLTELLGERSEVIRNEALLLLAALTRTDPRVGGGAGGGGSEVQKIAAFEGAFDRVAELLREEGGLEGGMVVQDAIELMNNLLRGNMANQRLFREMGHAAMLPRLITAAVPAAAAAAGSAGSAAAASPAAAAAAAAAAGGQFAPAAGPIPFLNAAGGGGHGLDSADEPSLELHNALAALAAAGSDALLGPPTLPRQKAANMLGVVETLRLLCAPPSAPADPDRANEQTNRSANQAKLLAAGAMEALTAAALQDGGVPSAPVRAAALGALGDLVDELAAARERLARATVRPGQATAQAAAAVADGLDGPAAAAPPPGEAVVPVLTAVLRVALYGADAAERSAAGHVIACYCRGNAEGQTALASTIGASGEAAHGAAAAPPPHQYPYGSSNGSGTPANGGGALGSATRGSFGQELVAGLLAGGSALGGAGRYGGGGGGGGGSGGGLLVTCRAAGVLQHLLSGNPAAKQRLLAAPLEPPAAPGVPLDLLMPRLLRHLSAALRPPCAEPARLVVCTLLRVLLVWLHDCPPAVSALLDGAAHLPLLVDLATGRQGPPPPPPASGGAAAAAAAAADGGSAAAAAGADPVVCGLAACVLGACTLYGKPPAAAAAAAPPPGVSSPADLVLDVVMSRVGLSLFLFRLDDLRRSPVFAAAAAAPYQQLSKPLTRAAAVAAVAEGEQQAAAGDGADGGGGGGGGGGAGGFELGHDVAGLVTGIEEAVRQRTMEVLSRPTGHRAQDGVPSSAAEVPGADDSSRLGWAVAQLGRMAREVDELRGRNRALAEDLFRLSQGLGSAPPAPPPPGGAAAQPAPPPATAAAAGYPAHPQAMALGHHPHPHGPSHAHPHPPGTAAMGPPPVVVNSAAEVEARVALELRAGRAEQEVAALRQQVEVMAARLAQAEADAAAAREAAATAHLAASKAEADLADLSGAYNNLEAHAFATEAQLRSAQGALAAAQAAEARAQAAGQAQGVAGLLEADVQRRIEEAVAEARAEGKAEAEEGMTDLFVCLGQEERKVEVLRQALEKVGVDAETLLATIEEEEGAEVL
ncbi:hypothetical protein PLESTF_001057900 [Pleodorina starrii]|nr:hypothetical protein PLESTF_001057900 [Pleodorina starrii]